VDGITVPCPPKGALDISRARSVLGYVPRFDIKSGLADTMAKEKALARLST
jgi:nucleoside-diphosphate-sugar epimerase